MTQGGLMLRALKEETGVRRQIKRLFPQAEEVFIHLRMTFLADGEAMLMNAW
jgi:hypothetical protein